VKNFPPTTSSEELKELFVKFGEIESIKLLPVEGEPLYAFVCYKSPDAAAIAKQTLNGYTLNGKQLYINFYELKEIRKIQQEEIRDKADWQNYCKQL
jgi:RNA recognition motif-containing protein